ncbi:MAG: YkgJ family cysteine cluster protein [Proteobacteria bacterium]|nr:hypothetical protein [Desulfobulbaceae bacterium]MBU4153395.1 YkgJ family cysteine cluster protein [Pseudomonadota bacterium]
MHKQGMERTIENQTTCLCCGTCCIKGGPALHQSDLPLIHERRLALGDMITIRQGEPVISPLTNSVEPARIELIKLVGHNDSWICHFFDKTKKTCGIYAHRPLECKLLKCWDSSSLTNIIYQHCLKREDILQDDEELWELISLQEEHCSFAKISQLSTKFAEVNDQTLLTEIAQIVTLDFRIRQKAVQKRSLSLASELLYFGRPLFKSLKFFQLTIKEDPFGVTVIPASFGTER